ncbi:hypothetical protein [Actinomadura sp. NTSP31]|uniref:hypothetical protein n=1 Tax=Actinomadura sp. NTSP31 TaxID=1735447 RepID=UPI0035C25BB5
MPAGTEETAAEIPGNLVRDVLEQVDRVLEASNDTQAAHDVSVYSGSAGAPPALFSGVTGAEVFLTEAPANGVDIAGWNGRSLPPPEWNGEAFDLNDGIAGVGLGHLYFYRVGGHAADLWGRCAIARESFCRNKCSAPFPRGGGRHHRGTRTASPEWSSLAEDTGDAWAREAAADRVTDLALRTRDLIAQVRNPALNR